MIGTLTSSPRWLRIRSDLLLLLASFFWGLAFVPQRAFANEIGVFWFNGSRFLLGALLLLPFIRFKLRMDRKHIAWAAVTGFLIYAAGGLQQAGLRTTTAGNAGFLTGLYVVFIPLIMVIFFRRRLGWLAWLSVGLAVSGSYLLSTGSLSPWAQGDLLEVLGAVLWAVQIILIGRVAKDVHFLSYAIVQYLFTAGFSLLSAGVWEPAEWVGLIPGWWAILYMAVFSVGVGFTLQVVGQKHAPATDASIIMSMEAVFAALGGVLLLGEQIAPLQLLGCGLMFAGMVLVQLGAAPQPVSQPVVAAMGGREE